MLDQLRKKLPKIMEFLDYSELSTPITTQHFMHGNEGACYGLESSIERYTCSELQPRTPLKNFYLTGVDIGTPGIVGGMIGGLLTASTIEKKVQRIMNPKHR